MTIHSISANLSGSISLEADIFYNTTPLGLALFTHLSTNFEINAIVSTRVYPLRLPQNPTFPCITFQIISEARGHTMEGFASPNPLVQVDSWAKNYIQSNQLSKAIENALDGFSGRLGNLLKVSECLLRGRQDFIEPEIDDFRVSQDFSIWHN